MSIMNNMVLISGQPYQRGSILSSDEQPIKTISLSPFFMDIHPVLNKDYRVFIEQGGYTDPSYWSTTGFKFIQEHNITEPLYWNDPNWNGEKKPVTGISWHEAQAFACFVGKELPTESQWEYAAKGNDNRMYPWGNTEPDLNIANFAPDCEPAEFNRSSTDWDAHPQNRSPFGCIDMGGNLAEWCLDNYLPNYAWDDNHVDPLCILDISFDHVVRGGSGLHDENYMRSTSRDNYPPTVRDNIVGFRCVKNITE
ncbi:SUMF1/EgtB/PvdO family nonheme iron enzyme [Aliivibrio fischeri]|nr:SUMF1/EgtB/PvdO family nonheme iron enzyme [Aliivibrio fischeri]